jgi:hypothetical protein
MIVASITGTSGSGVSLFAIAIVYFVPTIVAATMRKPAAKSIFTLNALLGWTILGWIAALVWALRDGPSNVPPGR